MDHLSAPQATSPCGTRLTTGPFDLGEAILLVDEQLVPKGWQPKYLPLTPVPDAMRVFAVGRRMSAAGYGQDLFVALRRAIITDQENDGADCPRAGAVIAHVEQHRPIIMYFGDEECMLAECDHPHTDGICTGMTPGPAVCVSCSAYYDSGSEWGPEWIDAFRVEWPCAPVRAVADHYEIPLPEREVPARG